MGSKTLTFTSSTWNTPQTVTLRAEDDADGSDISYQIRHAVSGADYTTVPAIAVDTVNVISRDDDTRRIRFRFRDAVDSGDRRGGWLQNLHVGDLDPTDSRHGGVNVTVTPSFSSGAPSSLSISPASISWNGA